METQKKQITIFIANDKKEFNSEKDCKKYEKHLVLDQLHKNLIICDFHSRCKINPKYNSSCMIKRYSNNSKIEYVGHKYISNDLSPNNSYYLMNGISSDDKVKYKIKDSTILMIKNSNNNKELLCTIPANWLSLNIESLKIEVDKFIENRNAINESNTNESNTNESNTNESNTNESNTNESNTNESNTNESNTNESSITSFISNLKINWMPKTKTESGTAYHGSRKGDEIEYTLFFDEYRAEWTDEHRAFQGHVFNEINKLMK